MRQASTQSCNEYAIKPLISWLPCPWIFTLSSHLNAYCRSLLVTISVDGQALSTLEMAVAVGPVKGAEESDWEVAGVVFKSEVTSLEAVTVCVTVKPGFDRDLFKL